MSLRDLEEMGILLPQDKWGQLDLHTSVNKVQLVGAALLAAVGAIMGYAGNGGPVTWVGVALLLVFFAWFTWLSMTAVDAQNEEVEDSLREE